VKLGQSFSDECWFQDGKLGKIHYHALVPTNKGYWPLKQNDRMLGKRDFRALTFDL